MIIVYFEDHIQRIFYARCFEIYRIEHNGRIFHAISQRPNEQMKRIIYFISWYKI